MTNEAKKAAIIEILENVMDISELLTVHRDYLEDQNMMDDEIFENGDEFFETFFEGKTVEAVRAVCYGDYRYADDYVWFNGYANLESGSEYQVRERIDFEDVAGWILDNDKTSEYDIDIEDEEDDEEESEDETQE